jgi:hypothetical protein
LPVCAAATARFTEIVVRPTPPFGLNTATTEAGSPLPFEISVLATHRGVAALLVLLARPDLADRRRELVRAEGLDEELASAGRAWSGGGSPPRPGRTS